MSEFTARLVCSTYLATLEKARGELNDMLADVNEAIARLDKFQPRQKPELWRAWPADARLGRDEERW